MNLKQFRWLTFVIGVLDMLLLGGWWCWPAETTFPLLAILLSVILIGCIVIQFLLSLTADEDEGERRSSL